MSIQSLYKHYRDGNLVVNRRYQRKLVWTVSEKQKLIDSILKDYPLPLFLLAEKPAAGGQSSELEIIDGMQRLNAIFSFIEQSFTHNDQCFDVKEFSRARQAAEAGCFAPYTDQVKRLSATDCANFLDYQLAVTTFPGELESRITDVFGRINSGGRQLSDQERRQAGVLSKFAGVVRTLGAEIRGDVSRESLLLSQMPEISVQTSRNAHGYTLNAEEIFWCRQGVLRTSGLRDSEDEQVLADLCATILLGKPCKASGEFLNQLYQDGSPESADINSRLSQYGSEKLVSEVKSVFSTLRATIEASDAERFAFKNCVYPRQTSNALKAPFFAVFMAFYELMYKEDMSPSAGREVDIMESLKNLSNNIDVGKKNMNSDARQKNIDRTAGLIRKYFTRSDTPALTHGPAMMFDFENSIRRSRTETSRYEFKQGILRLDSNKSPDPNILGVILETICGIANCGPNVDGYLYIGIADTQKDADRVRDLYGTPIVKFDNVSIVGIEREATQLGLSLDEYCRRISSYIKTSELSEPLKTQVCSSMDCIDYKGVSVLRLRVPRQSQESFIKDKCYYRNGPSTETATGPQIASISRSFAHPSK